MAVGKSHADRKNRTPTAPPEENEYPLQHVEVYEGGYKVVIGNKDGSQFKLEAHPSGAYTVHHPDGSVTSMTPGDKSEHSKGGVTTSIDHNSNVKVAGHNTVNVQGGGHIEVAGDANMVIAGSTNVVALGGLGAAVKGAIYLAATEGINVNAPKMAFKGGEFKVTAPMTLKGNITHTGDMVTSGIHTDSSGKHVG